MQIFDSKIVQSLAKADLIYEESETETYLCFAAPGATSENDSKFSICKVVQDKTEYPRVTQILWANGNRSSRTLVPANRANYNYSFAK